MKFRLFYKMSILFIVSDIKKGVDYCYKEFGIPDAQVTMRDRAFLKYPNGETVEIRTPESLLDDCSKYDLIIMEYVNLTKDELGQICHMERSKKDVLRNKFGIVK